MDRKFIKLKLIFLLIALGQGFHLFSQQQTNTDASKSYINVPTPKTPESAAFEKYGAAQVNEFTGSSSVSIPIYTLKGRFLEAPITLSYQSSGIRVNQEASWVGLGWDLIAGGRITVETRGCADFCTATKGLTSPTNLPIGMQAIFNRVNATGGAENSVLTPSTLCEDGSCIPYPPAFDNLAAVQEMTEFGTGEPDIFRANFMGHSITFYVDKISNTIKFIGEQSLFKINYTLDGSNNITQWTITDDNGIIYYFTQTETTTNTLNSIPVIPSSTTSAWLLTNVVHPSGDYIQYSYTNFGYTVPAFSISGSVSWKANSTSADVSNDLNQNVVLQSPYYLTKMETANVAVNFILGTRTDLYGPGSRCLAQITVVDKQTSVIKKKTSFNYSYFQSSFNPWSTYLNTLSYNLPAPLTKTGYLALSNQRLRLDSVYTNENAYQPPYKFLYNTTTVDKYSYSQDHWGFYNGVTNHTGGYTFAHLIPFGGFWGVQNVIPEIYLSTSSIGVSRDCDPVLSQAMILNTVVYPTGGTSVFTYEPHQSIMIPTIPVTGGGLRIKAINTYSYGNLTGTTSYLYSGGKYMGNIKYVTTANILNSCDAFNNGGGFLKYSSSGTINDNEILIGYRNITVSQKDPAGFANGSVTKTFNIGTSSSNYSNGVGYDLAPPYFPPQEAPSINGFTYDQWLNPAGKSFPQTPSSNLEGKLMQEQYLDNAGNVIKAVNYYYSLGNYDHSFFSIRAIENRAGGFNTGCSSPEPGFGTGGNRPVMLFISPAKSFHTLKDSVIETTYSGSNFLRKKTAYQYNAFYQPMLETQYNSDGTQTISYTRTSAEINYTNSSGTDFLSTKMFPLYTKHIIELPIEQTVIHRSTAGDSTVISSRFNVYQNTSPLQVYVMESQPPPVYRTQFIPWYFNTTSSSVVKDSRYKLYSTADYSSNSLIWTLHTLQGDNAFIWDEDNNTILAQCNNTDSANIAFTSFETQAHGRWTYTNGGISTDNTSPTGSKAYSLSSGSISRNALTSTTTYIISYWSKSGSSYTVTGSTSVKQGKTINGWTYFEHTVTGVTSTAISGANQIDELRLYPSTSQMSSYTYNPLFGLATQCDANNRISYYSYDPIGRLIWVKEQDGNIIKTSQYHYQSLPGVQY